MYLIDTNVISELRRRGNADPGVRRFFQHAIRQSIPRYLSVITVGELLRGVHGLRHRGDARQAASVESWLTSVLEDHRNEVLPVTEPICRVWARLRVPHNQHAVDKLIAATALEYGLTVVTRNVKDFASTGVALLNPFASAKPFNEGVTGDSLPQT